VALFTPLDVLFEILAFRYLVCIDYCHGLPPGGHAANDIGTASALVAEKVNPGVDFPEGMAGTGG